MTWNYSSYMKRGVNVLWIAMLCSCSTPGNGWVRCSTPGPGWVHSESDVARISLLEYAGDGEYRITATVTDRDEIREVMDWLAMYERKRPVNAELGAIGPYYLVRLTSKWVHRHFIIPVFPVRDREGTRVLSPEEFHLLLQLFGRERGA